MTRLLLITLFLLTVPVFAQSTMYPPMMCGNYDGVINAITGPKFNEKFFLEATVGLVADGPVMQTFANSKTKTWTQIYVPKEGVACVNSGGINFGKPMTFMLKKPNGLPL